MPPWTLASTPAGGGSRRFTLLHDGQALGREDAEHRPEANAHQAEGGDCYTKFPSGAYDDGVDRLELGSPDDDDESDLQRLLRYDLRNISRRFHLYAEEPCRSVLGVRTSECVEGRVASDARPRPRMLPAHGSVLKPTEITFNLRDDSEATAAAQPYARPGIVRRLYHSVEDGGCGACTDEAPTVRRRP